eukprot:4310071-Prymnesium_polylepis.1
MMLAELALVLIYTCTLLVKSCDLSSLQSASRDEAVTISRAVRLTLDLQLSKRASTDPRIRSNSGLCDLRVWRVAKGRLSLLCFFFSWHGCRITSPRTCEALCDRPCAENPVTCNRSCSFTDNDLETRGDAQAADLPF